MTAILSYNNSKIKLTGKTYGMKSAAFDLPAGWTCPAASLCHSRVVSKDGHRHIEDRGQFRCYATKAELAYTTTYNQRRRNLELTKDLETFKREVTAEIRKSKVKMVRIHSSGDFYNWQYFMAWRQIAESMPDVVFFAYTKQATFAKYNRDHALPNFGMVYSAGGIHDAYAKAQNLPTCHVVMTEQDPEFPIICRGNHEVIDFEYIMRGESFSILVH